MHHQGDLQHNRDNIKDGKAKYDECYILARTTCKVMKEVTQIRMIENTRTEICTDSHLSL
jgi:hypothetical protein